MYTHTCYGSNDSEVSVNHTMQKLKERKTCSLIEDVQVSSGRAAGTVEMNAFELSAGTHVRCKERQMFILASQGYDHG